MKLYEVDNQRGLLAFVIAITEDHASERVKREFTEFDAHSVRELPLDRLTAGILAISTYREGSPT